MRSIAPDHRQPAVSRTPTRLTRTRATLFNQDRFREATPPLTAAREQLKALNSSFSALADVELGAINYVEGRYAQADPALQSAFAEASARNYLYAAARATWFRGLIAFAQGRMADAQSAYEDTLATFDGMGDVEQSSAAHGLLSGLHDVLGNNVDEWQHRQRALAGLNASSSPRFRYSLLVSAAIAVRAESPETALVMLDSVVAEARQSGRDAAIVDSLAQRAATLNALGRAADAHTGHRRSQSAPRQSPGRIVPKNFRAADSRRGERRAPRHEPASGRGRG